MSSRPPTFSPISFRSTGRPLWLACLLAGVLAGPAGCTTGDSGLGGDEGGDVPDAGGAAGPVDADDDAYGGDDAGAVPDAEPPAPVTCDPGANPGGLSGGSTTKTKKGVQIVVRVPAGYDPTRGFPLVVVYAPAGANATGTEAFTGLTPVAKKRGYIVAYVDHITPSSEAAFQDAASAIPAVLAGWCVDPKRVYLTGHSDGGSITELLAASGEVEVAAVAPSAAGVDVSFMKQYKCRTPLAEMEIHGSRDTLFPVSKGFGAKVAQWWAGCDVCAATASAPLANGCVVYAGCKDGVEVEYCQHTGEHQDWPSLNAAILDFFDRFRSP